MANPLRPDDDGDEDGDQAPRRQAPPQQQAAPPRTNEEHGALHGKWMDWLGDPDNRAGMISFGASMLQPSWYGFGSTFGRALGAAGETITGRQELSEKRREAEEREAIARGNLAARVGEGGAAARSVRTQEAAEARSRITASANATAEYRKYVKDAEEHNLMNPKNKRDVLGKDDWVVQNYGQEYADYIKGRIPTAGGTVGRARGPRPLTPRNVERDTQFFREHKEWWPSNRAGFASKHGEEAARALDKELGVGQ